MHYILGLKFLVPKKKTIAQKIRENTVDDKKSA